MKQTKGFTLLEMLVAMMVLSMVVLVASNAYSIFSHKWQGRLGHFNETAMQYRMETIVDSVLSKITAYVVFNSQHLPRLYFEGNKNGFVAVSLSSIFSSSVPAVIRLRTEQNNNFGYDLWYDEWPMQDGLLYKTTQDVKYTRSVLLLKDARRIDFNYYGWPSLADKQWDPESQQEQRPEGWSDEFNALERHVQPEKVRVDVVTESGTHSVLIRLLDSLPSLLGRYSNE